MKYEVNGQQSKSPHCYKGLRHEHEQNMHKISTRNTQMLGMYVVVQSSTISVQAGMVARMPS